MKKLNVTRIKPIEQYHPSMWEMLLYRIAALIIILALFVSIYGFYLLLYPKEIINYPRGTVWKVLNSPIEAGSFLRYDLYYCKHTEDISTVYHTLSGRNTYTLAQVQRNIPTGCHETTISDIFIPPTVVPGKYVLYITVEYHPNPLRTVQYYLRTTEFEVTAMPLEIKEAKGGD